MEIVDRITKTKDMMEIIWREKSYWNYSVLRKLSLPLEIVVDLQNAYKHPDLMKILIEQV